MDALHHALSALVARAATAGENPGTTFRQIRQLAGAGGAAPVRSGVHVPPPERPIPARLTEPWFC
jgi:hypothetical protein